jgi:hypothetical protein
MYEIDQKMFKQNMIRTDMVHLNLFPEQANYLNGLLSGIISIIAKTGQDDFKLIINNLERALSYYEFCSSKENDERNE